MEWIVLIVLVQSVVGNKAICPSLINPDVVMVNLRTLAEDLEILQPLGGLNFTMDSNYGKQSITKVQDRIIGGKSTEIESVPYQASLYRLNSFLCGSAIIAPHFILTAAHCIKPKYRMKPKELWVRAGSSSIIKGGFTSTARKVFVHEQYNSLEYDIALVQVEDQFPYGPAIKAIPLPSPKEDIIKEGAIALVTGWGHTTTHKGKISFNSLKKINLPITTLERCRKRIIKTTRPIDIGVLCTISPAFAGTCFGDSGSPLALDGKLVGIVSWGSPCAIGDPDVFTNVQYFLPWIYATIGRSERRELPEMYNTSPDDETYVIEDFPTELLPMIQSKNKKVNLNLDKEDFRHHFERDLFYHYT